MDKKQVLIISFTHDPLQKLDVSRKQKDWSKKLFPCPLPVIDYNKHMGHVNLSDMLKGLYDIDRKTKKIVDANIVASFRCFYCE